MSLNRNDSEIKKEYQTDFAIVLCKKKRFLF